MKIVTLLARICLFILLLVTMTFCKTEESESFSNQQQTKDQKAIALMLDDDNLIASLQLKTEDLNYLREFYAFRKFDPVWIKDSLLDNAEREFFDFINSDIKLNLPPKKLYTPPFESHYDIFKKELVTLLRLSEYLDIQEKGFINFKDTVLRKHEQIKADRLHQFIKLKANEVPWKDYVICYKQKDFRILPLHLVINDFTAKYPLNDGSYELNLPDDTLGHPDNRVAAVLKARGFLGDTNISMDSLRKVLSNYQYLNGLNPDGKVGKNTIHILNESNMTRYYKGILALEKIKSIPDSTVGSKFIDVNIPSFMLKFYNADTLVSEHSIVVGAAVTQTPEFQAPIKNIVTYPYWHVPYSIASKEILAALRRDPNYLQKNNYELLKNGKVVSPDNIDWKSIPSNNFPYRIRQKGGPSNSLGLIKILFPNEYAVYIHDTPSKYLFKRDIRTFSHGCIRVEDPIELCRYILELEDHLYRDSLQSLIARKEQTYLKINDQFPVHVKYRTAERDDSTGMIRFYKDVYDREKNYIRLFPKPGS
ncbi:MAG: L,D-transpeptidase family protein [Brumimicrobium sp.]|nr:L,D-transpeptidase family protein [Brumimicrobium sp.]